ncbi:Uncharacterised protein [Raoultella ornithinolytica]|nr:Uncharacterised protein [Raoultella ornithinolytica]
MIATRLSAAETTLSINKGMECTFKVLFSKIGPKNIGKVKFGIRNLPNQKITDAMLSPGPNN